jgi:hypothetical protein
VKLSKKSALFFIIYYNNEHTPNLVNEAEQLSEGHMDIRCFMGI